MVLKALTKKFSEYFVDWNVIILLITMGIISTIFTIIQMSVGVTVARQFMQVLNISGSIGMGIALISYGIIIKYSRNKLLIEDMKFITIDMGFLFALPLFMLHIAPFEMGKIAQYLLTK